jgi:uncharacterized cupin superfamily protein
MDEIKVERPTPEKLKALDIEKWSPWSCEPSEFDWEYDENETCYLYEGKVTIRTPTGNVEINKGELVIFPKGLKCTWQVHEPVRKVFKFG